MKVWLLYEASTEEEVSVVREALTEVAVTQLNKLTEQKQKLEAILAKQREEADVYRAKQEAENKAKDEELAKQLAETKKATEAATKAELDKEKARQAELEAIAGRKTAEKKRDNATKLFEEQQMLVTALEKQIGPIFKENERLRNQLIDFDRVLNQLDSSQEVDKKHVDLLVELEDEINKKEAELEDLKQTLGVSEDKNRFIMDQINKLIADLKQRRVELEDVKARLEEIKTGKTAEGSAKAGISKEQERQNNWLKRQNI